MDRTAIDEKIAASAKFEGVIVADQSSGLTTNVKLDEDSIIVQLTLREARYLVANLPN